MIWILENHNEINAEADQAPFPWIDRKHFWGNGTRPINDTFHTCDDETISLALRTIKVKFTRYVLLVIAVGQGGQDSLTTLVLQTNISPGNCHMFPNAW